MAKNLKAFFNDLPPLLRRPKPINIINFNDNENQTNDKITFKYGTSGYRTKQEILDPIVARISIIAYIRSSTFCGKHIGILLTASHNPLCDNGIKLIDHNGDMFDTHWEEMCDNAVNCDDQDLYSVLNKIHRKVGNSCILGNGVKGKIIVGRDTRDSGIRLTNVVKNILSNFNCTVFDVGLVSTPQMHFVVRNANLNGVIDPKAYFENISNCYYSLIDIFNSHDSEGDNSKGDKSNDDKFDDNNFDNADSNYNDTKTYAMHKNENYKLKKLHEQKTNLKTKIIIDTANGISSYIFEELNKFIELENLIIWNNENKKLNFECGAEFVKNKMRAPVGFDVNDIFSKYIEKNNNENNNDEDNNEKNNKDEIYNAHEIGNENSLIDKDHICLAFDGDMDRLIFFKSIPTFQLFDGDKITATLALFFSKNISKDLSLGCILSHYSNESALKFISSICKVEISSTGIKNFVKKARHFDVGIYFEPNGHGGVVFSEKAKRYYSEKGLECLWKIFDPSIGDPLADFLILEALSINYSFFEEKINKKVKDENKINENDINCDECDNQISLLRILQMPLYSPCPVRNINVYTKGFTNLILDNENKIISHKNLALRIENLAGKFEGKVFIRSSGTENLIRVFTQAKTKEECDLLCLKSAQAVYECCGGIGDYPEISFWQNE
ncbi:putative phosphoacetylglucosamine mutase [Dictyocoela muelleri]|nr:putative phosphoacetylglucosamine mutase [Dictyocoela muelleri]